MERPAVIFRAACDLQFWDWDLGPGLAMQHDCLLGKHSMWCMYLVIALVESFVLEFGVSG